ncbi:TRAP transporter fused permease subunit [Pararhodobacter sp. CCB-MM2]|uniref:TRAP transporter permease n=1 Tax=Pararhodobacter sp. CCB-MM2 TaxID=1786003 RepID=UPI00083524DC|nr:TRAP transporter fused permease subunit [Pararhodobacter sp. CCB-MM2]
MTRATTLLYQVYLVWLFLGGLAWIFDVPGRIGLPLIQYEWLAPYLGVATAAVFLRYPYGAKAGPVEVLIGWAGIAAWIWSASQTEAWMFSLSGYSPDKVIPGAIALLALMEGLRKSCGLSITLLVYALVAYGLLGHHLPQPFQANYSSARALTYYLYTDSNAVVGMILSIVATLVLAFLVFGRMLEVSGATSFFTDLCLSAFGHRRGGPAKVAVIASGLFGSVSSSPVGNIMSTGVVTIPLMQRTGLRAHQAAAIEAVASTGGQLAPPVMGATAFLMAEFLQISYAEVVLAALLPAIFYYACLYFHVDALAVRQGASGLPKAELPRAWPVLKRGWIFVLPLAWLMYLLFWRGSQPTIAALGSAALLMVLALLKKRFLNRADWKGLILDGGEGMLPILMIAGGAGIVVGVMNLSGLAQSLSFLLTQAGAALGLFPVLLLTGVLCIILGMGMPSTAIYIVLATVIGPSIIAMGVTPLAAHMFIFYFGVMSFLTPPVAVSSYVAAGLAKANMWKTSLLALRAAGAAFVLPFVWCYREELLLSGDPLSIAALALSVLLALRIYAAASGRMSVAFRLGHFVLAAVLVLAPVLWNPLSPVALVLMALAGAKILWERLANPSAPAGQVS